MIHGVGEEVDDSRGPERQCNLKFFVPAAGDCSAKSPYESIAIFFSRLRRAISSVKSSYESTAI